MINPAVCTYFQKTECPNFPLSR